MITKKSKKSGLEDEDIINLHEIFVNVHTEFLIKFTTREDWTAVIANDHIGIFRPIQTDGEGWTVKRINLVSVVVNRGE